MGLKHSMGGGGVRESEAMFSNCYNDTRILLFLVDKDNLLQRENTVETLR